MELKTHKSQFLILVNFIVIANSQKIFECQTNVFSLFNFVFNCDVLDSGAVHSEYLTKNTDQFRCKMDGPISAFLYKSGFASFDKAREIHFRNCRLPEVPYDFMRHLTANKLFMGRSYIKTIENGNYSNNWRLEMLSMTHNDFNELPTSVFRHTTNLQEMDFSHNRITHVNPDSFRRVLKKLEKINLSHNLIEHLDQNVFNDLVKLKEFDLSFNLLEYFPVILSNSDDLEVVRLNNNRLVHIGCNIFANHHTIILSYNLIKNIDFECNLSKDFARKYIDPYGEVEPEIRSIEDIFKIQYSADLKPYLKVKFEIKIDITGNLLENLTFPASPVANSLKEVRASRNQIKRVSFQEVMTSLTLLDLSSNGLTDIPNIFQRCNKLEILDLSYNGIHRLSRISPNAKSLIELDLSHNKLNKIDFHNFPLQSYRMQKFYLNNNNISELVGEMGNSFPNLKQLSISSNNISCDRLGELMRGRKEIEYQRGDPFLQAHGKCDKSIAMTLDEINEGDETSDMDAEGFFNGLFDYSFYFLRLMGAALKHLGRRKF